MELSSVEQIKQRLDIVEVVGGYIKLQKAGRNFRAVCPFHKEKTPSFFVSPERQSWHCFGCNKGGDMFSFVQEMEGVEFVDALRTLAQRAGVELKRTQPDAFKNQRGRLEEANELACDFFETQLAKSTSGQAAVTYLKNRGVADASISNFRIGFAPDTQNGLTQFLASRGFSQDEIVSAGLALKPNTEYRASSTGLRDRFRGRVMFPIIDRNGKVLGFSGRIFGREAGDYDPKYLNSPETPIFDKGRTLFGLNLARVAVREQNAAVVVEGQMDCVMSQQAGVVYTVATSGTALTEAHLKILRRIADTIIFAYDMDRAGTEAARRGVDLALEEGFLVRVAAVPSGKDPADFIQQDGEAWAAMVREHTKPVIGFFIERALARNDVATPEGKRAVGREVLSLVAKIGNAIEQSHWVEELANVLGIRAESVWQELVKIKAPAKLQGAPVQQAVQVSGRRAMLEEHLLCLVLAAPQSNEGETVQEDKFLHPVYKRIFACVTASPQGPLDIPEDLKSQYEPLALRAETLREEERLDIAQERLMCLRAIQALDLRERLDALSLEIEAAEKVGDAPRLEGLMGTFREKMQELSGILNV